jgi:hypothetical protein
MAGMNPAVIPSTCKPPICMTKKLFHLELTFTLLFPVLLSHSQQSIQAL